MLSDKVKNLLSINWYDGLLVRSDHLLHADNRVLSLLSELCNLAVDQPGVAYIDSQTTVTSQLIEIEDSALNEDENEVEISFSILRPFLGISPSGNIIIAVPNTKSREGIPSANIKAQLKLSTSDDAPHLVCVRQESKTELNIPKSSKPDQQIELAYPGIKIDITTTEQYKSNILTTYRDSIPIALLLQEGDRPKLQQTYIPPVVRLKQVNFFDTGIVDSLSRLLVDLSDALSRWFVAGGRTAFRPDAATGFREQYSYYQLMNAILLSKSGLLRNIGELSPIRFFDELIYPLVKWYEQFYGNLKERRDYFNSIAKAGRDLAALSHLDLYTCTNILLHLSRDFVFKLSDMVDKGI